MFIFFVIIHSFCIGQFLIFLSTLIFTSITGVVRGEIQLHCAF